MGIRMKWKASTFIQDLDSDYQVYFLQQKLLNHKHLKESNIYLQNPSITNRIQPDYFLSKIQLTWIQSLFSPKLVA